MTKAKRYLLEGTIFAGLLFYYFFAYVPQQAPVYPGQWGITQGPGGKETRCLHWSGRSNTLFAGTKVDSGSTGIMRYFPGQKKWKPGTTNLPAQHTVIQIEEIDDMLWALYFSNQNSDGGILTSADDGDTWEPTIQLPDKSDPRCLVKAGPKQRRIVLGTVNKGIYLSDDFGKIWRSANTGLTNKKIQTLCVDSSDPSLILAGTIGNLFRSTDSGETWHKLNPGLSSEISLVVTIAADPHQSGVFFTILRDQLGMAYLMKSENAGKTWHRRMMGLPDKPQPRVIYFHPMQRNVMFLGTVFDGVFRSDNLGDTWAPMNRNFDLENNFIVVHSLTMTSTPPFRLYCGTNFKGSVWEYRFDGKE